MSKKILVAVTGSTPQILTETVYGLYKERNWVPDEIHVLTTTHGKTGIEKNLFENGQFQGLCDEYNLPKIAFTVDFIHLIHNEEGEALEDIKTLEDNSLAADKIVGFIYDKCQDSRNEIHVSLAGGRKSMGFYIGYALSLFGRAQDSMSHVLVSDPYDRPGDFYYPTKETKMVDIYLEGTNNPATKVDAKDAKIWLADIPFVRMGAGIPNLDFKQGIKYRDAVEIAQTRPEDYSVTIDLAESTLICNDKFKIETLTKQQFAVYATVAHFVKQKQLIPSRINNEGEDTCTIQNLAKQYIDYYEYHAVGVDSKEKASLLQKHYDTSLRETERQEIIRILDETFSKIEDQCVNILGDYGRFFAVSREGSAKQRFFNLRIKPENITIKE